MISFDRHSPGGLDVTESINLFFKAVLLFPIFLFAIYTGATMMKHMIFHGLPLMNKPSEEQVNTIRLRDQNVDPNVNTEITAEQVAERTGYIEQAGQMFEKQADGTLRWIVPKYEYRNMPDFVEGDRGYTVAEQRLMHYCSRVMNKPLPRTITPEFFDTLTKEVACNELYYLGQKQ